MKPTEKNTYDEDHPEQDPAEGSRDVIDHDLAETGSGDAPKTGAKPGKGESGAGAGRKPGQS